MQIDGRTIAQEIYTLLQKRAQQLHAKHVTPSMAVILANTDPAILAYIQQKKKWAEFIGAKVTVYEFPETATTDQLLKKIQQLNTDTSVHGIIVQRPLPPQINPKILVEMIDPEKDIDGFQENSQYKVPVALAVEKALEVTFSSSNPPAGGSSIHSSLSEVEGFVPWLKTKTIVTIGKGSTAGKPIIHHLQQLGVSPEVIDSKTPNPEKMTQNANIIISSVGKPEIVKPEMIRPGVILIGVGLYQGNDGKFHGDFDEEKIKDKATFYTPSPGGIGPINVAYLMSNLTTATEKQTK